MVTKTSDSGTSAAFAPGRLPGYGPVGVIDIGSNSVRLVLYERLSRALTPLFNEKVLAGLGKGLAENGRLADESVEAALVAIRRFRQLADQSGATKLDVIATAAVRDAENGAAFIDAVTAITGGGLQVLSGQEEAKVSALGVASSFWQPDGVVGDLGGGSLELIDINGDSLGAGETFPLGGLRLSETASGSARKAGKMAADLLQSSDCLKASEGRVFYAVGGTWRALANLHMQRTNYPLHIMHHYTIPADEAFELCRMVVRSEIAAIDGIDVVSRSRRALLPFGAAVLEQVLKIGRPEAVVLSALGLREGHLYEKLSPEARAEDPLLVAAAELADLRSRSPRHSRELAPWTAGVFEALGIHETEAEKRLRVAACLLADVAWRAHPDYRGDQAVAMIANGAFTGVDHPGRGYLALAIFHRYAGTVSEAKLPAIQRLMPARLKYRARMLGAAMRLAYSLSAAMPGIIPRTEVVREGERIVLHIPRDLQALDGGAIRRRLDQLADLGDQASAVVIV
ncbi:Ppx/GppA family phosphatase [Amorphus coralli]|uniref:Ppx/GppA family phosphatase n=1 Tax=Amorphus coralli TaxID=340680 RepID=UPI00036A6F9A|nr:Ppx/GppA phosphatase family protein [Amorphus coralli]